MDGTKELQWFGGLLAILFLAWLISGGPERYSLETDKPFIKPPSPLDSGEIYGPEDTLVVNPSIPVGWQQITTPYFTLGVPQGWFFRESSDNTWNTYRGEISNGVTTLFFDYGHFAVPPVSPDDASHTQWHETISGYQALLIQPKNISGNTTGMYVDLAPNKEKFSILGFNLSPSLQNTALTMFRTVQFTN